MRRAILVKWTGTTQNTTAFLCLDRPVPLDRFHINTSYLKAGGLGEQKFLLLVISTEPFTAGEVTLAPPPVPFYKKTTNKVRYQHLRVRDGKDRLAPNTPSLPVTLAYVNRWALDDKFIAQQGPVFFGVAGVMMGDERPADDAAEMADADGGAKVAGEIADAEDVDAEIVADDSAPEFAGETADAADRTAFDAFLRETVRAEDGGKLTSRRVWRVWAERCGADPAEPVIAGIRFTDVAGRVRATLGAAAAETPTRVDGVSGQGMR